MIVGPRHTTLERDPAAAALQHGENIRDVLEVLKTKLTAHWVFVARYRATGDTSTQISLGLGSMPVVVMLVRAALVKDKPGSVASGPIQGALDFTWNGPTRELFTSEPAGLTAGETYELTYLIGERE